jgi:phosphoglycerate dehydrogenase-like enzyme
MRNLVVTFEADERQRDLVNSIIENNAEIKYLEDFTKDNTGEVLNNADVLFAWNPPRELGKRGPDSFPNLKFIQVLSAGYDHVDFNMFPADCKIASNKGAYAHSMAEHILAMILALAKRLFVNHNKMALGEFNQGGRNIFLGDSVVGILGYGGIGRAAAKLIRPFGSEIYAINSSGKSEDDLDFIGTLKDLDYMLENCDIILLSLPLLKETENLIGSRELEKMKPTAILINVARAQIINEEALYNHLKTHPDFYAGIDTWWVEPFSEAKFEVNYPFFDLPNILGSPHNSPIVPGALAEGMRRALQNINLFLQGKSPKHIVNSE